jgi:hypothetical protein
MNEGRGIGWVSYVTYRVVRLESWERSGNSPVRLLPLKLLGQ